MAAMICELLMTVASETALLQHKLVRRDYGAMPIVEFDDECVHKVLIGRWAHLACEIGLAGHPYARPAHA